MEERYKCAIIVDLMLTRYNKENNTQEVLLMLRQNTGYNDGMYELPGGHVDEGEDLITAMIREAGEELKIKLKRKDLKIQHLLHHYKGHRLKFIISTNKFEGIPQIGEPDKCENLEWFDINNLPENIDKKHSNVLKEIQAGIFYDNSNFENLEEEDARKRN